MAAIPEICISAAPQMEEVPEPYSPFAWTPSPSDDGFRAVHLSPTPTLSPRFARQLSPLRPIESMAGSGEGLQREKFEALLKSSKDRNLSVGAKKTRDLRKEIALKAHKTKQVERRALFLSKVLAPASPGATMTPVTPPESPAIFHYTLPSPGLESPLALFESISLGADDATSGVQWVAREPWVEQVDFRMPVDRQVKKVAAKDFVARPVRSSKPGKPIPTLDEIAARVRSNGHFNPAAIAAPETARRAGLRLPAFLKAQQVVTPTPEIVVFAPEQTAPKPRARLPIGVVGRLQMPIRATAPLLVASPKPVQKHMAPPGSPLMPRLEITTTVVPRTCQTSPTELSKTNLLALDQRARTRKDLISTLKRRTVPSDNGITGRDLDETMLVEERRARRISAPAEMQKAKERSGFSHPVLSRPGGF